MKILLVARPGGAFGYITDSWSNALSDKGHIVQRWDGLEESWYQFDPDIYIGCSGHKQPIPHRRTAKVAIHVNPYGPVDVPGINEPDQTIKWVCNQKPDVVFGYGTEEDRILWGHWTSIKGIKWIPMPVAGDKILYKPTAPESKINDIVYLGGRWAYKGLTIDKYLVPLYEKCLAGALDGERNIKFKIHGWGDWPKKYGIEILGEDKSSEFIGSGKVGPCISEKHTHEFNIDIPERAFKVALCNTLVIHDTTTAIRRMIPSALVASNPDNFQDLCLHYSRKENQEERIALTNMQRAEVLKAHTYHHRMSTLFRSLGFNKEADLMIKD